LARYLNEKKRSDEAVAITLTLQKNYPAYPDAYLLESHILSKKGQTEAAQKVLDRGLIYNPSNQELMVKLNKRQ